MLIVPIVMNAKGKARKEKKMKARIISYFYHPDLFSHILSLVSCRRRGQRWRCKYLVSASTFTSRIGDVGLDNELSRERES